MKSKRVYLSSPHLSGQELDYVREALDSGWVAPLGPQVEAFEQELCARVGVPYATALSSGTAGLHLSLRMLGVKRGDEVICPTLTFAASANPIVYEGGRPVFIDSEEQSWNISPVLLREELADCARRGKLPRAVMVVDLYGQCADFEPIISACEEFGVPLIEDAAEALGAEYRNRPAGSFGKAGVFSFNGNKIITTSGGGMLVSHDREFIEKARFLATQARDSAPHYQHSQIGFNYRLSNILAAIGRAQLAVLDERVAARRANFRFYKRKLGGLPGIKFMPEADYGFSTRWLTCLTVDSDEAGVSHDDIRVALQQEDIEARPIWKPMHLQPVFKGCRFRGNGVSERIFATGLCLPSGSSLTKAELQRVCSIIVRLTS